MQETVLHCGIDLCQTMAYLQGIGEALQLIVNACYFKHRIIIRIHCHSFILFFVTNVWSRSAFQNLQHLRSRTLFCILLLFFFTWITINQRYITHVLLFLLSDNNNSVYS